MGHSTRWAPPGLGRHAVLSLPARARAVLTLVLIPTLYVMLEERFPRRIESPEGELVAQGDAA
jgi:hypothetical protein